MNIFGFTVNTWKVEFSSSLIPRQFIRDYVWKQWKQFEIQAEVHPGVT